MANPDLAKLESIAREADACKIIRDDHPTRDIGDIPGALLRDRHPHHPLLQPHALQTPKQPRWEDRDRFVLSKGHCVPTKYYCMASSTRWTASSPCASSAARCRAMPDRVMLPGIEAATGSLGQGLSVAMGMALGLKLGGQGRARLLRDRQRREPGGPGLGEPHVRPKLGAPDHHLDNLCAPSFDYDGSSSTTSSRRSSTSSR